jgi:hypothetical protein
MEDNLNPDKQPKTTGPKKALTNKSKGFLRERDWGLILEPQDDESP